jgi:hypothetical protein
MAPFAAPWDKPVVGGSAYAGLTGFAVAVGSIVAGKGAAGKGVAEKVVGVGVRASGGDSSSARGRLEYHSRRTNIRCRQGRQRGEKSNSSFMQVAEAEKTDVLECAVVTSVVLCEVNEWIGEWRTAGRINQCMRVAVRS